VSFLLALVLLGAFTTLVSGKEGFKLAFSLYFLSIRIFNLVLIYLLLIMLLFYDKLFCYLLFALWAVVAVAVLL